MLSKGHDKSVDYWALGCLIFELLVGHTPFQHDNQQEIFKRIVQSQRFLSFPKLMQLEAQSLVSKLLHSDPSRRLGNGADGVDAIMKHPWFSSVKFDWEALVRKELPVPYRPTISDPLDTSNFDNYPEDFRVPPFTGEQAIFQGF